MLFVFGYVLWCPVYAIPLIFIHPFGASKLIPFCLKIQVLPFKTFVLYPWVSLGGSITHKKTAELHSSAALIVFTIKFM